MKRSASKQCQSDPLPTWLLKQSGDMLAPFITSLLKASLVTGEFPAPWKEAVILPPPRLKRLGVDYTEVKNYWPVSNLPYLSKLLERVINDQTVTHLRANGLMPTDQSTYRKGHSTETSLLHLQNDIVEEIANGRLALLSLLDLTAAFDMVDHHVLIQRL